MEKLDIQAIVGSKLNFHFNDHVAIFSDFEEVRNLNVSDVLVEGFFFAVVTHGQAQFSIDDQTYLLKEGDVITCKPRNIFEKSMMSMDFNAMVLFLSPEYVAQLSQMIRMEWTYSTFSTSHKILHADETAVNRYRLYFDLLSNHLSSPDSPHKELSLRLLFASMAYDFHDLQRVQDEELFHQTYSSGENILRQFMQHLHDPSQPYLNVNEYASLFHITPKYFSSVCKRLTGKTANQLISDEIVRSAQITLRDSSKSIKQIAALMGFKNQSHFGRFFRQQTGVSPQQYREGKTL
ncbi:MAG: helix-turn-helix transcriptional regulator [Bacteroidaceae bacterium]|nr:helix-turn-helix transcriptional regulator [Bacteroidaceae bacterium]